jgi:hypothetical protein
LCTVTLYRCGGFASATVADLLAELPSKPLANTSTLVGLAEQCTAMARTLPPPPTSRRKQAPVAESDVPTVSSLDLTSLPIGQVTLLRLQLGMGELTL